jgi:phospholipid/cholesterol/gamma-HCH transport system substrate-binding protein
MLNRSTPILVGLMMLIGMVSFVATFGALDRGISLEAAYRVHVTFDDASGLVTQSRVMLSGIPVGEITNIELDPDDPSRARVTLAVVNHVELFEGVLDAETGKYINGASATRQQASLLGDYYVSVTPGLAGKKLGENDRIQNAVTESGVEAIIGQMEKSTSVIFPKIEQIMNDVGVVTSSLRQAVGGEDGTQAIAEIRTNVIVASRDIAAISGGLKSFLDKKVFARGDSIRRIVGNLEMASESFRDTAGRVSGQLDSVLSDASHVASDLRTFVDVQVDPEASDRPGTLTHTLTQFDRSIGTLQETLETGRALALRVEQGEGSIGRLLTDTKLIDEAEAVIDDIREFTAIYGQLQVKVDLRSEYQYEAESMKHYVNFGLYPRPDKFYFFQLVADPQGASKRSITSTTTTTGDENNADLVVTDETQSNPEGLSFSAQFGKRWDWFTLRYGLMESSGGVGVDMDFFNDALSMRFDIFDFSRSEWPRVRALAAWEFVKHVYVAAGVDDGVNSAHRDFFFGVGVRFDDDDIKSILPVVPSPM